MPTHRVESIDLPLLAPYRNLKDKELARDGRRFIAEGEQVVRRLFASALSVESVLLSERKVASMSEVIPANVDVFVAPDALVRQIIGFEFHSGVMAVGFRPERLAIESIIPEADRVAAIEPSANARRLTLAIAQQITNTDNLGSLIRICTALGVDGLILGERCCDPYFRHCVRVSMGNVFRLPIVESKNLLDDLASLKSRWRFELIATTLDADAEPLNRAKRSDRIAIVFGSEADGLDAATLVACDRRITIPMRRRTDSLNVAVAAGIFLHYFVDMAGEGNAMRSRELPRTGVVLSASSEVGGD